MIFAFSRDGGLPGSTALAKVSPTYRTPVAAIWTGVDPVGAVRLGIVAGVQIGDTSVYTIVVSCTVIFLFLSFTMPIVLRPVGLGHVRSGTRWVRGTSGDGIFKLFAVLSIVAMILIFIIGIQPPNDRALYITVGFFILTAIVWFAFENSRFQGPPIGDDDRERRAGRNRGSRTGRRRNRH